MPSDSIVHDRFLLYPEYETLLAKAAQEREWLRSTLFNDRREWIVLDCHTGLHPGEQRVLEFSDINLEHGFVRVQSKPKINFHVKNYQHRYIPLALPARDAVVAQRTKKLSESDFVFHRPDGSPWGDIGDSFDDLSWRRALQKETPAERLTPHSRTARAQEYHHHGAVLPPRTQRATPRVF